MQVLTAEDISKQIKPLSGNGFVNFFQKIWRKWLAVWYGFSDKHPKLSKLMYQIIFCIVFSMGVTIFQYLVTLFLPQMFGLKLAGKEFLWPKTAMYKIDGVQKYWTLLGYDVAKNSAGEVIIGGGLGYFLAFEIATFLAQIINFPLQRNITFKSHGNPYFQAMWYFIGWVAVSLFCNGINSLWLPLGAAYLPFAVYNILTMISMGGISIAIFFFIFLIIFPDYNAVEKRALKKVEKLAAGGADAQKLAKAKKSLEDASAKAKRANAEKAESKALAQASSKAMTYFAVVKNAEAAKAKVAELQSSSDTVKLESAKIYAQSFEEKIEKCFNAAIEAIAAKEEAINARNGLSETYNYKKAG